MWILIKTLTNAVLAYFKDLILLVTEDLGFKPNINVIPRFFGVKKVLYDFPLTRLATAYLHTGRKWDEQAVWPDGKIIFQYLATRASEKLPNTI